jgi:hypothetical protein
MQSAVHFVSMRCLSLATFPTHLPPEGGYLSLLNTNSESQPSKNSTSECRILLGWKMASQSSRYQHGINALYVGDHDIGVVPICSSLISRRKNQNQND